MKHGNEMGYKKQTVYIKTRTPQASEMFLLLWKAMTKS